MNRITALCAAAAPGSCSSRASSAASRSGVQFSWMRSGTASRSASRFTSEACGTSIKRRTMAAVTALTL